VNYISIYFIGADIFLYLYFAKLICVLKINVDVKVTVLLSNMLELSVLPKSICSGV
jgi:hypothetical protein